MLDGAMIWIDIETTGLNSITDKILEIGLMITNPSGTHVMAQDSVQIWGPVVEMRFSQADEWVQKTHTQNGLIDDCLAHGVPLASAEDRMIEFLNDNGASFTKKENNHLCGSSVHFDQRFLSEHVPLLSSVFHYRMVDISTLKLLCEELNPDLYRRLPRKKALHRALPDLKDTIAEYQFYRQNFLFV